jgi:flagellar hook-associated protein 3 FlgL
MRISTSWAQQLGVNAMNAQQVKMSKTQMQLSSGLNILTPSDDPAAAVRTLSLQETIDKTAQYQDNIDVVRSRLNIEESSLGTAENVLFRAKELTVQSLNSTLSLNDRLAIKSEIDQLLQEMVGVANTKNANGEYIYSGDLSTTPAVAWDPEVGSYVYQGGINQRVLDIAPERRVADGDLGFNVFQNIDSVSQEANATVDGNELNTRSVFDTLQALSFALEQKYEVPEAVITGDRFMRFGIDYSLAGTSFTLDGDDGAGGTAAVTINLPAPPPAVDTGVYTTLDEVVSAINLQLAGSNMQALSNGNNIEFTSFTKGKDSNITITGPVGAGTFVTDFGFSSGETGNGVDLGGSIVGGITIPTPPFPPANFPPSLAYAGTAAVFELNDEAGNKQEITLNADYADHLALIAAIQLQITGSPIDGKIEIDATANPIEFKSVSTGSSASVQIKQVSGDFLKNTGFTSGDTGRLFSKTANDALADLDTALNNILQVRTTVGSRLRALDDQAAQNEKFELDMRTTLSDIRDLDYAEAISRFNIEQSALQAAQQAFSRVQNLSLFNFL